MPKHCLLLLCFCFFGTKLALGKDEGHFYCSVPNGSDQTRYDCHDPDASAQPVFVNHGSSSDDLPVFSGTFGWERQNRLIFVLSLLSSCCIWRMNNSRIKERWLYQCPPRRIMTSLEPVFRGIKLQPLRLREAGAKGLLSVHATCSPCSRTSHASPTANLWATGTGSTAARSYHSFGSVTRTQQDAEWPEDGY